MRVPIGTTLDQNVSYLKKNAQRVTTIPGSMRIILVRWSETATVTTDAC